MKTTMKAPQVENSELTLSTKILDVKNFEAMMSKLIRFNNEMDLLKTKKLFLTIGLALLMMLSFGTCVQAQISDWYNCSSECYIHSNMGTPFTVVGIIKKDEGINGLSLVNGINTDVMKSLTVIRIDTSYINNVAQIYYEVKNYDGKIFGYVLKEKLMTEVEYSAVWDNKLKAVKAQTKTLEKVAAMAKAGKSDEAITKVLEAGGFTADEIFKLLYVN